MSLFRVWLLIAGLALVAGCSEPTSTQQTFYAFGTEIQIRIDGASKQDAQAAIQEIEQQFHRFHNQWHAWQPTGQVFQINQAIAKGKGIEVPQDVKAFIQTTQRLSAQTDYLFDPAIGKLIAMWGFHREDWQGPPPSEQQRQTWLENRPSIADLYFEGNTLYSKNPNVQLDFGGNAKGMALNIAMHTLRKHQIEHALVNIGGDLQALGEKSNHQAWSIGIQNPENPNKALAKIDVHNGDSVFTSGTYQRFYEWQGQTFSHIINPNTAWPADSFASVTVVHRDPIVADTAATALLIAGPQGWQKIAAQMGLDKILMVQRDGKIELTPAMQSRTEVLNNSGH